MTTEYILTIAIILIVAYALSCALKNKGTSEFCDNAVLRESNDLIDDARNSQLAKLQRKINKEALKTDENESQIFLQP